MIINQIEQLILWLEWFKMQQNKGGLVNKPQKLSKEGKELLLRLRNQLHDLDLWDGQY